MIVTKEEETLMIRFKIYACLKKGMEVPEISVYLRIPTKIINEQLDYMRTHLTSWMFFK